MTARLFALNGARRARVARPRPSSADAERSRAGGRAGGEKVALGLIDGWRKSWCNCGTVPPRRPEECPRCTRALIDAVERALGGCETATSAGEDQEEVRLVLRLDAQAFADPDEQAGDWLPVCTTEPPVSGTYQVRLGPGNDEPVLELPFDAAPGVGWRSGEQPPNDYVVLPMTAQWRPIAPRGGSKRRR